MAQPINYSAKGTAGVAYPIERISRKLALRKELAGKNCVCTPILSYRKGPIKTDVSATRQFISFKKNQRSNALNTDEIWARQRFTAVSRNVAARMKNLSTISADQAAFEAQKNTPGGLKSFKSYIWSLEGDAYDTVHPRD